MPDAAPDKMAQCVRCDMAAPCIWYHDQAKSMIDFEQGWCKGACSCPCEGSGCPPATTVNGGDIGLCPMCGGAWYLHGADVMPAHDRRDILAMLARGDFG